MGRPSNAKSTKIQLKVSIKNHKPNHPIHINLSHKPTPKCKRQHKLCNTHRQLRHNVGWPDHAAGELDHTMGWPDHAAGELDHTIGWPDHAAGELDHSMSKLNHTTNTEMKKAKGVMESGTKVVAS